MIDNFFASRNSLDTYKQCKYKFFLRYCEKTKGFVDSEDKKAAVFGNVIHKVQELYHKDSSINILDLYKKEFVNSDIVDETFFNLGYTMVEDYTKDAANGKKILGLELPFELYLTNGVPVKGIIDRIDEISDEEIEIIDYKTSKYSLTEQELRYDLQLGLYDIVTRLLFPKYKKVKLTLNYLHYGKVSIYKTDDEREKLEAYVGTLYDKIVQSLKNPNPETMQPRVNSLCSFCEYKAICPEFQKIISKEAVNPEEFKGLISKSSNLVVKEERLNELISNIKAKIKILKEVQDQANAYLKEAIRANGGEKANVGGKTFYLAKKKYTKYDVNTVIKILKDKVDLNIVLEPIKGQIDSIINNEEDLKELNATARIAYSDSYVK